MQRCFEYGTHNLRFCKEIQFQNSFIYSPAIWISSVQTIFPTASQIEEAHKLPIRLTLNAGQFIFGCLLSFFFEI